ncbi:radial spoke head 10 homolog B [Rhinophrynus dorsalis]
MYREPKTLKQISNLAKKEPVTSIAIPQRANEVSRIATACGSQFNSRKCCNPLKLFMMVKNKKKENKKADKHSIETSDDDSCKISTASLTPSEELSLSLIKSTPHNESMTQEEPADSAPVTKSYEEPVLTQLVVEKYEGDLVHGLYEGEGVAYFKDGNVYRGMFSEGLMHGNGSYMWTDGLTYQGDFYMNFPMGHGKYTWPDGSRYEGEVYKAIRHGIGIYTSSSQQVSYTGEWHKGKRHGKGTIYYNKEGTSWYEGDWNNNSKEGWGVQCFQSGNMYEGQWRNNTFHGEGKMRWLTSNEEYVGQWENGIQNGSGTHTWFLKRVPGTQYPLRNEYVGNFVNGVREGHGQFYYANGAMYDGEWVNNKKHGMGKFVFKNGQIYIGEFVEDQIAEYPNFKYDRVNTPDLSGLRTRSPIGAEKVSTSRLKSGIPSLSGSYIELDISALLNTFPELDRLEELKQVEYAVLRNLSELRKVYKSYSSLGNDDTLDNALLMTRLQFWRFLKDCKFHHYNLTLFEMDRILTVDNAEPEEIHSPHVTMLLRTFLTNIIYLAFHICHMENLDKTVSLAECFSKIMTQNIHPHAHNIKGYLFSDPQKTVHAMMYIDKCWDIYRIYCHQNTSPPYDPTMRMRHFMWMMNDFKITSRGLTATAIVDILADDDPCVRVNEEINLDLELTFLEFFEALLGCAAACVTEEYIEQYGNDFLEEGQTDKNMLVETTANLNEHQTSCIQQHRPTHLPEQQSVRHSMRCIDKGRSTCASFYSTKKKQEVRRAKWFHQINIFFLKMFFPAHDHAEQLKEEIPKIRVRQAEQARLNQIREEEEARLKALQEAEEARRIVQLEEEKALAETEAAQTVKDRVEDNTSPQHPSSPKEEPPTAPPPSGVKTAHTPGKKKRK